MLTLNQSPRSRFSRRGLWMLLALLAAAPIAAAQQPMNDPPMAKKLTGRLPAHFSRVVSSQQRETIYRLQANYAEKIAALKKQIAKLVEDRDQEVDAVLTADQRRQVNKLREEARLAREARAAAKAKARAEKVDGDSTESTSGDAGDGA